MTFFEEAERLREKLDNLLAEDDMVLSIHETYPLTLVISRNQAPEAQLTFLSAAEGNESAPDFSLRFIFRVEGLEVHTDKRMRMTDDQLTKIKSLAKKWHTAYTHAFFATSSIEAQQLIEPRLTTLKPDDFPEEGVDPFAEFMDDRAAETVDE